MAIKAPQLMLSTQAIRAVIAIESQQDILSNLSKVASATAEALDQVQTTLSALVTSINSQSSSYPQLSVYENDLSGPLTLTGTLQDVCAQTIQSGGNYVALAQTIVSYTNDDVVYMELDVDGVTQANTIGLQSAMAGFSATLPANMAWYITATDNALIELKAKKSAGTGTSAITQASLLLIQVD